MQQQFKISPPDKVETTVHLPASKSISNRALILNALSLSTTPIRNLSDCEDTQMIINSFNSNSNLFDVKGAGTAMRFLTAFLAGMDGEWIIRGNKRMHERPIHPLVETLVVLGAEIDYLEKEGFPPLRIKGHPLKGGEVFVAGNISSQFISALLMIAPLMEKGLSMIKEMNGQGCVLVGDPSYYIRFNFSNIPDMIHEGIPQEVFLALPFGEHIPKGIVEFDKGFLAKA